MKKVFLCLTISVFLAVLSCSKDDNNDTGATTVEIDPSEEVALDATDVSKNIEISGATKIQGNAPTPNGAITFTIDKTNQSAFQKNGFDIKLQAPENYAGVYIQVKDKDGAASEYFDIPAGAGKTAARRNKKRNLLASKSQQLVDTEVEIDVDFINVPPGKFCYLICVYDGDGNVSEPVEVCVAVEAWAGNPNLVGIWTYTKQVANGETIAPGEVNFCEGPGRIDCRNGAILSVEESEGWCYASTAISLELKEDGTYLFRDLSFQKQDFDFTASSETCTVVNNPSEDTFGNEDFLKGYWAFDEEEGYLYLIEFEDYTIYYEDNYEDIYNEENGYLSAYSGFIALDGNNLVIEMDNYGETSTYFHYSK